MATYHDKLVLAFTDTNGHIHFRSSTDGANWSAGTVVDRTETPFAPALVVHSDTLVYAYARSYTMDLVVGTLDDELQGTERFLSQQTDHTPSVASYDNRLFVGWTGVGNKKLNWEELDLAPDHTDEIDKVTLDESSDDGLFITGNGSHFIASWRGEGSTRIHRAILGVAEVDNLAGTVGESFPNDVELTEDSPYTPTVARLGPTTALLWAGTDARVNIRENLDKWTMTCLNGEVLYESDGSTPRTRDNDRDGIFDCLEDDGVDVDGDGVVDLDLPALGASSTRKDLFVELDYFDCKVAGGDCAPGDPHTHKPLNPTDDPGFNSIGTIQSSFINVKGVSTSPSLDGINLHVQIDEALPHQTNCAYEEVAPSAPTCLDTIKTASFGTVAERSKPNAAALLNAKREIYRYSLWTHIRGPGKDSSGFTAKDTANGCARNFIVSLAPELMPPDDPPLPNPQRQAWEAGTFMHELGHSLGLQHGGADAINYKPNFLSIMNYMWQAPGMTLLTSPAPPAPPMLPDDPLLPNGIYDYSHESLATLWELAGAGHSSVFAAPTSIQQNIGIQGGLAWTALSCPNRVIQAARGDAPIDFTCGGQPNDEQDINNDRYCVVPPSLGTLSTLTASGDDKFQGGFIIPAAGSSTVNTPIAMGDVMQALPESITRHYGIAAGTMAIAANPNDGYLRSVAGLDTRDRVIRSAIVDGADRTCNTMAAVGDLQPRAVGNVQFSAALTGYDDWSNLQYGLSSCHDTGGDVAGGSGADTQELEAVRRLLGVQQMYGLADLTVAPVATMLTTSTATTAILDVTVSNHGPASTVLPTLSLRLPTGLTPLTCDGQPCTTALGNTVVVLGALASGASRVVHFELSVSCNVPTGTVLAVPIAISDVTVDPRPNDNAVETSLTVLPRLQDYTLFGSNLIDVDNNIVVQSTAGPPALLGNGGGSGITVGNKAQLGEIRSIGPVFLKNNVSVVGSIASSSTVTLGNNDLIGGTVTSHTSVSAPTLPSSVTFPPPSGDVFAPAGSPVSLAPGSYGAVTIRTHGELDLSAGTYFFGSVNIASNSRVVLDKSQGPITINVATTMTMKSSFVDMVNPGTRFLLQYFGTASVDLDPFNGTFVAPSASVDLASPSAGVFLAKELHAKSKVIITRRAFDPACQ